MNKQLMTEKLIAVANRWDSKSAMASAKSFDFALYRHKQLIGDNGRYPDEKTMFDCVDLLVEEGGVLRNNDYDEPAKEMIRCAYDSPSWTSVLEEMDIEDTTLGEIRESMKNEKYTLAGLMAEVLLQREEKSHVSDALATSIFLERLKDYQESEKHNDEVLWYLTFGGRLGKVLYSGEKQWAQYHLKNGDIQWDDILHMYVATRVIDNEGCTELKRHRAKIAAIGCGWSNEWISKIESYLDGGCDCTMIIDRNFEIAYEPQYHENASLEGDFVDARSCMSGKGKQAQSFYGGIVGCSVARFENADGQQVGRCLIYEYDGIRHFMRIYAKPEYQNVALRLLKAEMRENDIRGRSNYIEGLKLETTWDENTRTMYLDGCKYGVKMDDGKLYVVASDMYGDIDCDMKTTSDDRVYEYMHVMLCEHCGKLFIRRNGVSTQDLHRYCCQECAIQEGYMKCECCGDWVKCEDMIHTEDEHWFCGSYCATRMDFVQCNQCKKWHGKYNPTTIVTLDGKYYCSEDCAVEHGAAIDSITGKWTDYYGTTAGGKHFALTHFFDETKKGAKLRRRFKIKLAMNRHYKNKGQQNETNNN